MQLNLKNKQNEKRKKFALEKFYVAKLKNLKKIIGGNNTNEGNTGNDDTILTTTDLTTSLGKDGSNGNC